MKKTLREGVTMDDIFRREIECGQCARRGRMHCEQLPEDWFTVQVGIHDVSDIERFFCSQTCSDAWFAALTKRPTDHGLPTYLD